MWSSDQRSRTLLLAAAGECLTTIGERNLRWQFVRRASAMATQSGVPEFDESAAHDAYSLRSCVAHGGVLPAKFLEECADEEAASERAQRAYWALEEVVRGVLRSAITLPKLRAALADDESLDVAFPVRKF